MRRELCVGGRAVDWLCSALPAQLIERGRQGA